MATNRFDVGLNPIQIGTPVQIPFEEIVGALGAKQEAYNQTKNLLQALEEKTFQNLQVDADIAARARQDQIQLVDNLLEMNQGDLAKGAPEIEREVRKFARRYGPSGDIGGLQAAYTKAQKEFETIDKSNVPVELKQKAKQELLYSYGNLEKGAYKDAFGNMVYNQFGDAYVPEYVNVGEEALKLAKEVPLEKIAETKGWFKSGYTWFKNSSMTEKVTFDDIVEAITPFMEGNPKIKDYLNFEAKMNTFHLGDSDLEEYNNQLRTQTLESNEAILRKRGDIIAKLNDPSKFKSIKEYQNYINSIFGKQVIDIDGTIGEKTERAKARAIDLVNENMITSPYSSKDLDGVRKDYVSRMINNAIQGAAEFYEQYNITQKDQDMKFDAWEIALLKEGLEKEIRGAGQLAPTLAKQQPFEGSPLNGGVAKVKGKEIILEQSKKAQAALEYGQLFGHPSTRHLNPGAYLWSKIEATWHNMFSKDRLDASNPDIANAINNTKYRLEKQGTNTDGYTEQDWLELVAAQLATKQEAAGQEFYTQVIDEKAKNNWEGVWSEKVRKEGKDAFFTDPFLVNREIHGTARINNTTRVTGDDLAKKIKASGPISYGGTNFDISSSMEYGTDVIKIGQEEFYVEPSPSIKMTSEYFANGVLRARFGLGDTNYFEGFAKNSEGIPMMANYRSEYHAEDGTYKVQIQTGKEWKDIGTFTETELTNNTTNE